MSVSIRPLLVANRCEIAVRIIRAACELGLQTVAVHREDGRYGRPHRASQAAKSYLNVDALLKAAA